MITEATWEQTIKTMPYPSVQGELIPRFDTLRWVPVRYRDVLPLEVMKQYQCVVIGTSRGVLTVAMADDQDTSLLESLSTLTGYPIFPVLISPTRMRLLIQRIERSKWKRVATFRKFSYQRRLQAHALMKCARY